MPTAYTCVTPGSTGAVCTGVAVAATGDTINGNDAAAGAILIVTVAGTPTNVTFVDPGRTPAGTLAGTVAPVTVAANTSKAFGRLSDYIDSATNTVGVSYSSTTGATAQVVA